ncbi:alpha/beta fold hydrolase [Natrarchaeobius sp. A-rgal3]|uniref:alpha/beta fold hydrolase n=1 Tax=Natrarchaeobius versutus TaxID=1679078 RepID=UPI00350F1BEF
MTDADGLEGWIANDLESNGIRLRYYRSGGDGPPLVVAHGITSSARATLPLLEGLAGQYDVIAYDARGHGRSGAPKKGYAVADQVDDLVGLVDGLSLEEPILYGHSMGGTTVAAAAARRPDLPRAAILEDPALMLVHDADSGETADVVDPLRNRIVDQSASSSEELLESDPELRELVAAGREGLARRLADAYLAVDPSVENVLEAGQPDPDAVFPEMAVPTLVLKADAAPPVRQADREIASQLPDGDLVHVDGAGHCVLRDEYDRTLEVVRGFLEGR